MSKSPSALPAFSYSWVGGDIHGLSSLAGLLYGFAEQAKHPAAALKHTVDHLVTESQAPSWKGSAADGFRVNFSQDVTDVNWLSSCASSMADAVDKLAVDLAKLESWLEKQAEQGVRAKCITIDGAGKIGFPSGASDPNVQKFLQQFNQCRAQAIAGAKAARRAAASKLSSAYKALSSGLVNYRDNHQDLLSKNEIGALKSSLAGLGSSFGAAEKPLLPGESRWKVAKEDAQNGAFYGGVVGSTVGGVVGGFIGGTGGTVAFPFVGTVTGGAAGAAGGALIGSGPGAVLGSMTGYLYGLL